MRFKAYGVRHFEFGVVSSGMQFVRASGCRAQGEGVYQEPQSTLHGASQSVKAGIQGILKHSWGLYA